MTRSQRVNSQGKESWDSRCKGPGVCGTVCVLWGSGLLSYMLPGSLPFCPDSCFSDSALQYVWGSSLGSWMDVPFWYINLKICWNSSPLPHVCRKLCLAHRDFAIQSGLPLTFITFWFLCLCFCLRSWKTSCIRKTLKNYLLNFEINFVRSSEIQIFCLWFFSYLILTRVRLRRSTRDEIEGEWCGILDWHSVPRGLLLVLQLISNVTLDEPSYLSLKIFH